MTYRDAIHLKLEIIIYYHTSPILIVSDEINFNTISGLVLRYVGGKIKKIKSVLILGFVLRKNMINLNKSITF